MTKTKLTISTYDDIKNPYYGGGGAIAIHEISKRLIRYFDITIISWNHSGKRSEIVDGVNYKRIGWKFINPKLGMVFFQLSLPIIIKFEKFDIWLESFCPPFTTSFLPLFTKRPVIGIVHMLSGGDMARKYNLPVFVWVEKLGLKFYKDIIVTSENYKRKILAENNKVDIKVIPNGIEKIINLKSKKIDQILYLGRLEINQKGLDLLIKVFQKFSKLHPKTKLLIAGSGIPSELKKLKSLIENSKLNKLIDLVGKVDGKEKHLLMQTSKVIAISSRFETFSMTALEAMAYGLPIVCFDIDGLNWIGDDLALKTKPFNINLFTQNLVKIFEKENISNNLSKNGRVYAKQMTWNIISNNYKKYLLKHE